MAVQHSLTLAFGLLGNIISFMVYLAPIPTFYKIYKRKSTEGFQSIPYVFALLSSMLWLYYATLKGGPFLLFTVNSVGLVIELSYVVLFLFYAPEKARMQTMKLLVLMNVVGYGSMVVLTLFLSKGQKRIQIVGWICLAFNLSVFAAPLGVVRQVIRTKSVEYMPFPLSLSLTLNAVMWFFYGFLLKDYMIAFPNVLGFVFGIVQMVLYVVYKNAKKVLKEEPKLQVLGAEAQKIQALTEHIIEVVELGSMVCPEVLNSIVMQPSNNIGNDIIIIDNDIGKEKIIEESKEE